MGDIYTAYVNCYCGGVCPESGCSKVAARRATKAYAWRLAQEALEAARDRPRSKATAEAVLKALQAMAEAEQ